MFSRFTQGVITALFCLIGGIVLLHTVLFPTQYTKNAYYALLLLSLEILALVFFYRYWGKIRLKTAAFHSRLTTSRRSKRLVFFGLLFLCFVIRLFWTLRYRIYPYVDYYAFFRTAGFLSQSFDISNFDPIYSRYNALFPHIFGYASFLSLAYAVLGRSSPLAAALINVVLSTISMALIYYIGWKLSGRSLAISASLIWIFFPSQIIYNMFVLSEPYYTMLLASLAIILFIHDQLTVYPYWKTALAGCLTGGVLAVANAARPISAIIIIALVIVFFVIQPVQKSTAGKKALVLVSLCAVYALGGVINNWIFEKRIGEAPASVPGYNMYVGFNEEAKGRWNQEDSWHLSEYSAVMSAKEAQQNMLKDTLLRIQSDDIHFLKLFYDKLTVLWGSDADCVAFGQTVITHKEAFSALCNGYYYFIWILSIIGALRLFLEKKKYVLYLIPLYLVGLSMAHMLVEVKGRYHYSALLSLTLLAAYGLQAVARLSIARNSGENAPSAQAEPLSKKSGDLSSV